MPLTIVFAVLQLGVVEQHELRRRTDDEDRQGVAYARYFSKLEDPLYQTGAGGHLACVLFEETHLDQI